MSSPDQWLENAIIFGVYPRGGGGSGVTPQQVQQSAFNFTAATGIDDAFEVTLNPPVVSLTDGLLVTMSSGALQNNTSSPTLKVDSLPPKPIVLWAGTLAPGDIENNASYIFIYNLAADQFQLVNPSITTADTFATQANFYNVAIDTGAPNAYVATIVPNPTNSIGNAFPLYLVIGVGNTNTSDSAVTLNGTSYPILMPDGTQIPAGALVANQMAFMLYSSSKSGFILMNPVLPSNTGGTLNHLLRSNGTIWVQSTSALLDASDNLSGLTSVAAGNLLLSTNTLSSTNSNGNVCIIPNGTGATLIGSTTAIQNSGAGAYLQVARGGGQGTISVQTYLNTAGAANLSLIKSRSTTIGSFVAVANNDGIGSLNFFADDGTQLLNAATITSNVTATVSTGIIPTNLVFKTMNTSGVLTTALTISNAQNAAFAGNITVGNLQLASNTLSSTNTNGNINLSPNGTGAVLIGSSTAVAGITDIMLQVMQGSRQGGLQFGCFTNDASGPQLASLKTRSTTVGTHTTVQNGDRLLNFNIVADDGTNYKTAAQIISTVSGAVSTGIVPTSLSFLTTNTSGSLVTALTISNAQIVTLANALPVGSGGTGLTSLGTGVQTALGSNVQGSGGIALDNGNASTFLASLSFNGGNTGLTFTNQIGAYTRVGNTVIFSIRITLSAIGSATGTVSVTGFPIAGRNVANLDYVFETATQNMVYTGQVKCIMLPGTTSVMLYNNATGAGLTQLTQAAFTNTSDLIISGSYLV